MSLPWFFQISRKILESLEKRPSKAFWRQVTFLQCKMWRQSFFKAGTDSRQKLTSKKRVKFYTATICTLAKKATATTAVLKLATKGLKSKRQNNQSPLERPLRTPRGIFSLCCLPKKDEEMFQFVVQHAQKPNKNLSVNIIPLKSGGIFCQLL